MNYKELIGAENEPNIIRDNFKRDFWRQEDKNKYYRGYMDEA